MEKVIGPISVTVREAIGQRLRDARQEHRRVEGLLKHHRSLVAGYESALERLDESILDLANFLGDEEAARWDID